jgi:hypothetical protein
MSWVVVVILFFASCSFASEIVVVNYEGGPTEGDAWITLTPRGDPTQLLVLQHVTWCKSFVPNDQFPTELAPDCKGRNLMRLLLFPGAEEVVLKERPLAASATSETDSFQKEEEDKNGLRFYIDPARVGGWDTRHQWNIYLEMSQRNGVLYKESIRFNPIAAATTASTAAAAAATTDVVATSTSVVVAPTDAVGGVTHDWKTSLLIFCVGVSLVAGTALGVYILRHRPPLTESLAKQRSKMQTAVYGRSDYSFQQQGSVEMTEFSGSAEVDALEEEDLKILSSMR